MRLLLPIMLLLASGALAAADSPVSDLPLHVAAPPGDVRGMVVLWSGDGGWGRTVRGLSDALTEAGFGVVGVNALRYFWYEKAPGEMAEVNARLIDHYRDLWDTDTVILAGQSFGANTLPFSWPLMKAEDRDQVSLIVLMSPFPQTEFEITFKSMIGISHGSHGVVKAIDALPADRVLCILGEEERDMACSVGSPFAVSLVPGGHRYNGNSELVSDIIVDTIQNRSP